jgi:hypothetical protein
MVLVLWLIALKTALGSVQNLCIMRVIGKTDQLRFIRLRSLFSLGPLLAEDTKVPLFHPRKSFAVYSLCLCSTERPWLIPASHAPRYLEGPGNAADDIDQPRDHYLEV